MSLYSAGNPKNPRVHLHEAVIEQALSIRGVKCGKCGQMIKPGTTYVNFLNTRKWYPKTTKYCNTCWDRIQWQLEKQYISHTCAINQLRKLWPPQILISRYDIIKGRTKNCLMNS